MGHTHTGDLVWLSGTSHDCRDEDNGYDVDYRCVCVTFDECACVVVYY